MQINWDENPEFDGDVVEHPRNIEYKFKNIVFRCFINSPQDCDPVECPRAFESFELTFDVANDFIDEEGTHKALEV